jgi:dihydroorotate dehydrogenase
VLYAALRPLLFRLDAERAHDWTFALFDAAERLGLTRLSTPNLPPAPIQVMGLPFANPVGLAAGLDKNGEHIDALATLGFGFIEVGTVTPRPQPGNVRPRLFRIPQVQALVNRMGFNNLGLDRLVHNVGCIRYRGILGINIGKNADTPIERAAADYVACMRKAYPLASYLAVNISSPNTKDLRRLQQSNELGQLLAILKTEQQALTRTHGRYVPLTVKIAPDLADEEIETIGHLLVEHGVDGVIATNTTISRRGVEGLPQSEQAGGMSGGPLRERSTAVVRRLYATLGERVPIIGVGGILCAEDALEKIAAGAKLIQLYSGLVYAGPGLVGACVRAIGRR